MFQFHVIVEKMKKIPLPLLEKVIINFGNEYVKGAFDMTNRYMAGDWRQLFRMTR